MSIYYHISLIAIELIMLLGGFFIGKYTQKLKDGKRLKNTLETLNEDKDVVPEFKIGAVWACCAIYFGEELPYMKEIVAQEKDDE